MPTLHAPLESSICDPLPCQWPDLSAQNAVVFQGLSRELGRLREDLRATAWSLARDWTHSSAEEWGIHTTDCGSLNGNSLVVSGHQPGFMHSGIAEKTARLAHFVQSVPDSAGLNIVLDTDESDGMPILFAWGNPPQRNRILTSTSAVPFAYSRTLSSAHLKAVFKEVLSGLSTTTTSAAQHFSRYERFFDRGDTNASTWSAVLRRAYEGQSRYLDLPFSCLMQSEAARAIMAWFLRHASDLHRFYNQSLHAFRADHKIENPANPFPDLTINGDSIELPMWVLNVQTRQRVACMLRPGQGLGTVHDTSGGVFEAERLIADAEGPILVPRGALISLFMRVFLSDSFIHGTGGDRYDQYTDQLIQSFVGITPPGYITITATRLLYPEEGARIAWAEGEEALGRIAQFHPRRFITEGFFRESDIALVLQLAAEREALVVDIKRCKDKGISSRNPTRATKLVDRQLGSLVKSAREEKLKGIAQLSQENREAYLDREYPALFFSPLSSKTAQ